MTRKKKERKNVKGNTMEAWMSCWSNAWHTNTVCHLADCSNNGLRPSFQFNQWGCAVQRSSGHIAWSVTPFARFGSLHVKLLAQQAHQSSFPTSSWLDQDCSINSDVLSTTPGHQLCKNLIQCYLSWCANCVHYYGPQDIHPFAFTFSKCVYRYIYIYIYIHLCHMPLSGQSSHEGRMKMQTFTSRYKRTAKKTRKKTKIFSVRRTEFARGRKKRKKKCTPDNGI